MAVSYQELIASAPPDPIVESNRKTTEASLFTGLQRQARASGLLGSRLDYYAWKIPATLALYLSGWAAFMVIGASWWQLLTAVFLGFCYGQVGLLGHDVAHQQVSKNRRVVELLGAFHGDLLLGFSYNWWTNHHNRHHSNPNHLQKDPDILRRRVIFTPEQFEQPMSGARRFIIKFQDKLFFPLLMLESLGLRIISVRVIRQRVVRRVWLEGILLGAHLAIYFTVVFCVLRPWQAVAFVVIHQCSFGLYTGAIFAPNHKGLPVRTDEESLEWFTRQVVTSRNIRGGLLVNMFYGGLNYQIEHHLFPGMPRPNLRRVRPLVISYCREHEIPYYETSVARSYIEVTRHLGRVSREARHRNLSA